MKTAHKMRPAVERGNAAHRGPMECGNAAMESPESTAAVETTTAEAATVKTAAAEATTMAAAAATTASPRRRRIRRKHAERDGGQQSDHHLTQHDAVLLRSPRMMPRDHGETLERL